MKYCIEGLFFVQKSKQFLHHCIIAKTKITLFSFLTNWTKVKRNANISILYTYIMKSFSNLLKFYHQGRPELK